MSPKLLRGLVAGAIAFLNLASLAAPHKVRVGDPAAAKTLTANGARVIADYGAFQLLEADDDALRSVSREQAQPADEMNVIELNARHLDTRTPEVLARRQNVGAFPGRRLHLVHFAGPIKPEWIGALEQNGIRVVTYIPQNAYLVYGDAPSLARLQSWARTAAAVQWDGDYGGDLKIDPQARLTGADGRAQNPGTDTFAIQMVDDADANAATLALIDRLKLAPIRKQERVLQYLNVIVRLPADRLDEVAARPEVVSIQPYYEPQKLDERQDQIVAGNVSSGLPSGPGYLAWLASKGFSQTQFTAASFVVDVSDSGVDNGTTAPGHFGLYESGDPSLASRVVYNRLEGLPNPGSTKSGCDGHGNLNAHIIGAFNDLPAAFPHADSEGYRYGLGICPFVKVGSSVIFDPDLFTLPDYENLQSEAYHDGARISANSWGVTNNTYTLDAQAYDALVRDAQPAGSTFSVAGNQQMVIVFAANNRGPNLNTVGSPGTAKNVISVGASESVRSLSTVNGGNNPSGNDGCSAMDSLADNANEVPDFSSRGPCSDGRAKPDLVAPGTHITGGVGQSGLPTTNGTGSALACFDANGVCALPGSGTTGNANNFFPLGQQFYTVSTGTSHSTPAVAGACALLRQYFINNGLTPPSPAMTKACLLNSARYLTGYGANDTLWSTSQGLGELNLGTAFDGVPRALHDQITAEKFTATGQTRTFSGTISDPSKPFRVTLAWTDAPGSTSGNAYKNNLDLTVTLAGGVTYKGNVFSGPFSVTGGAADSRNNVESVFLPPGISGSFVITVTAANINSDGVPNESPSVDQDFALVIYNAVEQPVPLLTLTSAMLSTETCSPTNGVIDPGETVTVAFALKNIGTANSTNLVATLLPTNGVIFPNGPMVYGAIVAGGGSVTQSFTFTALGLCGGTIFPTFQLQDDSINLGRLNTSLTLGAQTLTTWSETNSANIKVPASGTSGKASPYPSDIVVSGVTGQVSKVTVTLVGVTHTFPDDIDALLVGPTGANVMLMSDCGGNPDISGVTLTFDDSAVSMLPDGSQITSGTFRPSNYDTATDNLPAPAPAGPFGAALSVFNGMDPNGTWLLYVQDDANNDSGNITGGWRISITTSNTICCLGSAALADLAIGESVSPASTNVNGTVAFSLNVTNFGPSSASSVTVTDTLPAGLTFLSANLSQGTFTNNGNAVTCDLGTLASGATAFITLYALATTNGSCTNTAGVSSSLLDPSDANNTATAVVAINAAPTMSTLTNQTTDEDIPIGPIDFTIGDAETPASALSLAAGSSDTNLIPIANIVFGGAGPDRTLTITPATNQNGASTIRIIVSDGEADVTNSFLLTVLAVNDPPVLGPIPNRTMYIGTTLVFTNSASDPDVPADSLTFSLGTNAPAGAVIDSASGILTWTPGLAFVNTTNDIPVLVTDDGVPPLSDSKSFMVAVLPPPTILSITAGSGLVTITWSAIDGLTYRLQYKNDLFDPDWTDLPPDVTASGDTASASDSVSASTQRFYRIVVP